MNARQCVNSTRRLHAKAVIVAVLAAAVATASAQTANSHAMTDKQKIADALRAGPTFVTKDATVLDWLLKLDGEYRILRKGTGDWTCLPGNPDYPPGDPGCFDRVFLQFVKDSGAGRAAHVDRVGISYMYMGARVPHEPGVAESPAHYVHVGPHIMIVTPNQADIRAFDTNAASGMPYINHLPGRPEMFLVIPIRGWDERQR
jgi:hypothetical protein